MESFILLPPSKEWGEWKMRILIYPNCVCVCRSVRRVRDRDMSERERLLLSTYIYISILLRCSHLPNHFSSTPAPSFFPSVTPSSHSLTSTFADRPLLDSPTPTSPPSLSIHLPLIFSLMWWCRVIWGSCLRGRGRRWVRQSVEKKRSSSGTDSGDFFFLVFDTNISFNSSFTFTYDKTLSEGKDMSPHRKIRHPTIPSRWKLEANPCLKIWLWLVLEAKYGGKPV